MTALLEVSSLTKRFGGVTAVDACTISVRPGTVTALIGPNGSGKTTVFNIVTGYLRADEGTIAFDGRDVHRLDPADVCRRGLTRTFQQPRIFREMTLVENLVSAIHIPRGALFRRNTTATERSRAKDVLARFGLDGLAENKARELSYGQQKLLEFATVLMGQPKLVLLDEPTAGVNPVMIETMERHIRDLHGDGITFLIVEHEMNLVMRLCDPIIVLDHGTKLAEGPPADVQRDPVVLEAYLGA